MIDWRIRIRNKAWLLSLVSALLIVAQIIGQLFGVRIDNDAIMTCVNLVLSLLTVLGVVIDPTTPGVSDK